MEEAATPGLVGRVWAILVRPGRTWREIATEPLDVRRLFLGYAAPLAAIAAVCGFAGPLIFTFDIASVRLRPDPLALGLDVAVRYVATFPAILLLAGWIALWARAFRAITDFGLALKAAAYSGAPLWIAGVFSLYPSLGLPAQILGGLYSLFILYRGLAILMAPEEGSLIYFAVVLAGVGALALGLDILAGGAAELGGPLSLA